MNPVEMTAVELVAAYASGALSPVEATTAVLDRIEEEDGTLGAFCLVDRDGALAQATASEERWRGGYPAGLLDGVPVSIKDIFLTEGWPTLRGSRSVDPHQPWDVDSPVAARLRADGMVFVGKTTTPEIAWKAVTDSPLTGITRNPADPTLTAGGSSGGAAAAVAAGMGPCAVGTDGGGSIRIPASFCGIVGFKPTHGRVPMFPASPFGPLAHAGPMTRTVEDAALLMDILSLPDPRDPTQLAPPSLTFRGEFNREVTGMHVAYSRDLGYVDVDPEVAAVVDDAVAKVAAAGLEVTAADPGFTDPLEAFEVLWASGAATLLRTMPGARETVDPGLGEVWDRGERLSAVDYLEARAVAAQVGIRMGTFHERHNVLLTPTVPIVAFEAGHDVPPGSGLRSWAQWTPFTYPFNLTQQPAISIPVGWTAAGLPVGLQVVGPRHSDDLVLAVARFVEWALG
ncbi:amidase/aspartyl-tRNA(Asn)/glutamyl-tRNA(Gln) amidotransferase subunit A [Georgenia satyanarayanai]|uniref:Amidase/aspartyl-tRNA(Asn)/glutamyl-tRNA(Gln) amidotransferase subunit A n=1 Tax=Georgenia satyanarayanai TaxID=860221 RepID=A0A2Y8ZXH4_9MICO|nr:amidase [Georgenia satyanarayanai]PYG02189.1 amidase/aspartyl-tRNA(Asn)/glutamyl-tRNA(Gln) amidotransferase subunit A [Georgenia satyanarayanai]SSA37020.1 amidase/aspartyl-tRNA(Asn)/glutamyl-tRNA(Gln) amidotransferase subunit A [Georgenia satyanarayanai]